MLLRKRKTTTHHNEITADAPCQKAIEGQAKNPTSCRFHFFNVLLGERLFDKKELLKAAGFQWDNTGKTWMKKAA